MKTMLYNFVKDEQGQDLIEYMRIPGHVNKRSGKL